MGAREDILDAVAAICMRSGSGTFAPQDVIDELSRRGSNYSPATIRTHIVSRMCGNAPDNHGTVYNDLQRVAPGRYRLRAGK